MKRKSTACHIARLLFLVLIVALLPVSVWAQETTLTTTVPAVHTLYIALNGNGQIVVDGVPYEQTADIQIKRHSTPEISVIPDSGWKLKSVSLNGQNVTEEFQSGVFTFSEMREDLELTVVFEAQSSTPQTGDQSNIEILYLLMFLSVIGTLLCVLTRRKTRTNNA